MKAYALLAFLAAVLALVVPAASSADDPQGCGAAECIGNMPVVPSLDPEWSASFVPPALPHMRKAAACIPTDVVFYAPTDWLRIAQKMRANMSLCANYYVSIPPLAADKTKPRGPNQAPLIRALGSQFHAVNEVNVTDTTSWKKWVADGTGSWYDAGVEARRRMDAPTVGGFDPVAGDIWAVNEFTSAVRAGTGTSRQNMRDFVHGLYDGDGGPQVKGLVWISNMGQGTTFFDTYRANLKGWLADQAFWSDMSQYVRFVSQEAYGRIDKWAVPGTTPQDRLVPTADYLQHYVDLSGAGAYVVGDTASYLADADAPVGNAAWSSSTYEWPSPAVDYTLAAAYTAGQVYAFRHEQDGRSSQAFGFAWSPANPGLTTTDFNTKSGFIADTIAAAIHASDAPSAEPGLGACGADLAWCTGDLPGASFNTAWRIFHDWTQPTAGPTTAIVQEGVAQSVPLSAADPDPGQQLTFSVVTPPLHGTATTDGSAAALYTPAPGYFGADSFTFRANDGWLNSNVATVTLSVNAPPVVTLAPAGPVNEGAAPVTLTPTASDPDGDPITYTWTGATPVATGETATFAADDGPAIAKVAVAVADGRGGSAKATIDVVVNNVPPTATADAVAAVPWGVPATLTGHASDPSSADSESLVVHWSFGDGSGADTLEAMHSYADPGTYTATFAVHDKDGGVGSDTTTVTVLPRASQLAATTHATVDAASAVVGARFGDVTDPESARVGGHVVTLAIGGSSCTATTNVSGDAQCTLGSPPPLGHSTVTARFDGDSLYTGSSTSSSTLVYRFPAGGAFAIGDGSVRGAVTFWSPMWWIGNTLSGGPAPASFKGFATHVGDAWVASPGFGHAPAAVPEWMGVLVASKVEKAGSLITVTTTKMVVVHVELYDPALMGLGRIAAPIG